MPELAEVEYYRKIWNPGLRQKILRVHVHPTARVYRGEPVEAFARALEGTQFLDSFTHGKNMLFSFSRGIWIGGHLGMTGEMIVSDASHAPAKHDHLVLFQKERALVFRDPRMFGRLRIHEGKTPPAWWEELPPGVLTDGFTAARVTEALTRHGKSPMKALLLDQSWFPGIGNWMADEILWRLKWHPARLAGQVPKRSIAPLRQTIQQVSQQAMDTIGQTWADPPDTWLFNHRWKDGGHCPRCRTPLIREDLRGRTCCWCPKCQKA